MIDVDHGGDLDEDETKRYLRVIGVPDYQLGTKWQEMLSVADTDGDGVIDRAEFLVYILREEELTPEGAFVSDARTAQLTAAITALEKENEKVDAAARNAWWIPSQNLHVSHPHLILMMVLIILTSSSPPLVTGACRQREGS